MKQHLPLCNEPCFHQVLYMYSILSLFSLMIQNCLYRIDYTTGNEYSLKLVSDCQCFQQAFEMS